MNQTVLLQVNMRMRESFFDIIRETFSHERKLRRTYGPMQSTIDMVKLLRVYGGCLGVERRRRTWLAAISPGQVSSNR